MAHKSIFKKAALKAKNMSNTKKQAIPADKPISVSKRKAVAVFLLSLFILCSCLVPVSAAGTPATTEKTLIAAGIPFGVRLHTDGVIVVNLTEVGGGEKTASPAKDAGIRKGDIIISVNGERMNSASSLCDTVEKNGEKELSILVRRGGEEKTFSVKAHRTDNGKYKIGVLARDNAAGIGTVTFIDPETCMFMGLGHGICDGETGELVPVSYGTCEEVRLTEIIKGKKGAPGELRGFFTGKKTGKILKNSFTGVSGALSDIPADLSSAIYPAAGKSHVHSGKATVITSVDGSGRAEYEIVISEIDEGSGQKNFTVEITDPRLLEKTGGIVQGMSGSPIIQDGYLIGAVTHVMISNPRKGYGILIENMLDAAG